MGVYNNNNGTLTPIANETQFIAPVNEYVTKPELEAIVPSDTSAENKLVNSDKVDGKVNDVWKVQGEFGVKNLIPFPYADGMLKENFNGITFEVDENGVLTASGTSTAYASYDFKNQNSAFMLEEGDYTLTRGNGDIGSSYAYFGVWYKTISPATSQVLATTTKYVESLNFTITKEMVDEYNKGNAYLLVRVASDGSGRDWDGVVIYPMIRLASDTDSTYQPYAPTNYELMQSDNALAEGLAKFGKRLWNGNFSAGSIEVAGAAKYSVILVYLTDNVLTIGNHFGGGGSYGSSGDYGMVQAGYRLSPTTSGDNIIYNINETAKGGRKNGAQAAIIAIYGLF